MPINTYHRDRTTLSMSPRPGAGPNDASVYPDAGCHSRRSTDRSGRGDAWEMGLVSFRVGYMAGEEDEPGRWWTMA
jgi:hypothetical protein